MSNLNFLLKCANLATLVSLFAFILVFSTSLFGIQAHASPLPLFSQKFEQVQQHLATRQKAILSTPETINRQAIHHALAQIGDGSSYQWQHKSSKLKGRIKPTTTYLNAQGQLCRHIHFSLYAKSIQKQSEALACRSPAGHWIIKG